MNSVILGNRIKKALVTVNGPWAFLWVLFGVSYFLGGGLKLKPDRHYNPKGHKMSRYINNIRV